MSEYATVLSTGHYTGTPASPDFPHYYKVVNPTKQDIENSANADDYPRSFGKGSMSAFLKYTKPYIPTGNHDHGIMIGNPGEEIDFRGNRNPKFRNPRFGGAVRDSKDAIRAWWCELALNPVERQHIMRQIGDVMTAVFLLDDTPLALEILKSVNLSIVDSQNRAVPLAEHVKKDLEKALTDSMYPEQWDYMDPETRPAIPYTPPDVPRNTGSGTKVVGSGTVSATGMSIETQ